MAPSIPEPAGIVSAHPLQFAWTLDAQLQLNGFQAPTIA